MLSNILKMDHMLKILRQFNLSGGHKYPRRSGEVYFPNTDLERLHCFKGEILKVLLSQIWLRMKSY